MLKSVKTKMLFLPHLFLYFRNFDGQNNADKNTERSISCFFNTMKINAGLLSLVFVLFFVNESFASNYYIATTGSDAANGTAVGTPKLTLQDVINDYDLGSGDIIYVAAGTYTEKNILLEIDDEGFTIQGAALSSGVPTSIFDSDQTNRWLRMFSDNNDNISFVNLMIKDYKEASRGGAGIDYTDGASSPTGYDITGITITNCFFDNCDAATGENGGAIFYYNTLGVALSLTITGCSFYNCNGTVDGPVISIYNNLAITASITKCKMYDNSSGAGAGYALHISAGVASTLNLTNCLIHSNSSSGSGNGAIYIGSGVTMTAYNNTIYNNTCTGCTAAGLYNAATSNIYNSILKGNSVKDFYDAGTGNAYYCSYDNFQNVGGSNNITTDPLVTSNYKLRYGSPCINTGTPTNAPSDDLASITRTGNPDIGCYERDCSTPLNGTYEVGATGQWTSLTSAIADLQYCMSDDVILELQSTYDATGETFPINFTGLPTSASVTLTVRPKTGVTEIITSSSTTGTILLDGADYIYFNGSPVSPNTMSNANNLTISNTSTTGYVFKFINDATWNKVEYCNIRGVNASATNGSIWFSTGAASGTGNEYNQINYCEIYDGGSKPTNAIYALGDATVNNNITINRNYIYNFFNASANSSGVFLSDYNTDWNITNNKFYQTAAIDLASNVSHRPVYINFTASPGNNFTVTGNTIGFANSSSTGIYDFTGHTSATTSGVFTGIHLKVGTTTASTVSANTIAGITLSDIRGSATASVEGVFNGIAVLGGAVTIGSSGNANVIGSSSTTSSITFYSGAASNRIYGVYLNTTGTVTVAYNTIGGFSTGASSGAAIGYEFAGIYNYTTGTKTISNNTIGSTTTANSIAVGLSTTTDDNLVYGIQNAGAAVINFTSNTIQNLTNYSTNIASVLYGIYNAAGATSTSFTSNTISTLKMMYDNSISGTNITTVITCGIYNNSSVATTMTSNTITTFTIKNGLFKGLHLASSATHTINSNTISDITVSTEGATTIYGVYNATTGTYNMKSNIISNLVSSATSAHASVISGIWFQGVNLTSTVEKNKLTGFSFTQASTPIIYGIYNETSGSVKIYNNLFICNNGGNTNNCKIFGVYDKAAAVVTLYYNTFSISGSASSGTDPLSSACYAHISITADAKISAMKNNIFQNSRTGSTNRHYCYYFGDAGNPSGVGVVDYNYYAAADDSYFGYTADAPKTSAQLKSATLGYGGTNSKYFSTGPGNNSDTIIVNSDGSLSKAHLDTVARGADLYATSGCETDIYYVARYSSGGSGGSKGCYEGPCLVITSNPRDSSICVGGTYSPVIRVQNLSSVPTTFNYQMEFSTSSSGSYGSVINNTPTNSTYTNGYATYTPVNQNSTAPDHSSNVTGNIAVGTSYYYRYLINASTGCSLYTNSAQLTISASNTISSQSTATQTVCPGVSFSSISVTASGANLSYQWYSNNSSSNTGGTVINSETANTYTPASNVVGTKYYYCVVSGSCGGDVSSSVSGATIVNAPMTTTASSGDYVWKGANSTWSTVTNWLSYNGTSYSVASVEPSSSNRTIISALNSCATTQPVLGANSTVGSLIIEPSSSLSNSSYNLNVNGDFTNNGTFTSSSGTVTFTGSGTIGGSSVTTFNNLTINGASISVDLSANTTTVQNTLTLTNGKLDTKGYTLNIGTTSTNGTVSGGSATAYVVAYDNGTTIGKVKHYINSAASYVFPIGDATNYTPLTYSDNSGTLASDASITVYTKPSKISGLNSAINNYLNRFWEVTPNGITNPDYDISYTFVNGDLSPGTNATLLYPIKLSGIIWYKPTGTSFTTGTAIGNGSVSGSTLTWTGLTSFSSLSGVADQPVALPISLISFTGKNAGADNELKWVTASEKNNNYFTIEKTTDGTVFDILGVINGAGTSNAILDYKYTDYNVSSKLNYYRLKQTDYDGVFKYTDLISIDNRNSKVEKQIATITNILGQEVNENYRGLVIIVYTDGSSEKVIR